MRISDWSSDVCSSDLHDDGKAPRVIAGLGIIPFDIALCPATLRYDFAMFQKDIGNIHGFIQQTARIGAQIEDVTQRLVSQGFLNAPDRRLHIRPRISGKANDINDANAVLDFPTHRLEFNDFARSEKHTSELQSLMRN